MENLWMDNLGIALISFLGVVVSVFFSFIISKYNIKTELQKIHSGLFAQFYSKRLDAYLEIYELVSGFIKIIRRKEVSYKELNEFYEKYSKLDSKSGLLFSHTTYPSGELMKEIGKILSNKKKNVISEELKDILINRLAEIEQTMRHEVGAYLYRDPTTITKKIKIPERKKEALKKYK